MVYDNLTLVGMKCEEWLADLGIGRFADVEFSFFWFEMIYSVTSTEEEAWELFFRLSYEYLDQLEAELGKSPSDV